MTTGAAAKWKPAVDFGFDLRPRGIQPGLMEHSSIAKYLVGRMHADDVDAMVEEELGDFLARPRPGQRKPSDDGEPAPAVGCRHGYRNER
jgi:hypothetical protein